jgi:hypothetical protein
LVELESDEISAKIERIMKEHGWLISRKKAEFLAELGENGLERGLRISEILSGAINGRRVASIEGKVERVLGKFSVGTGRNRIFRRSIILEEKNESIAITLWGDSADIVDCIPVRRGDTVEIKNLFINRIGNEYELQSSGSTSIAKLADGGKTVTDFSSLGIVERDIDIAGRLVIVENIGSIRASPEEARSMIISDGKRDAKLLVWRFLGSAIENIPIGSRIVAESISVRKKDQHIEMSAGSGSRLLVLDNIQ